MAPTLFSSISLGGQFRKRKTQDFAYFWPILTYYFAKILALEGGGASRDIRILKGPNFDAPTPFSGLILNMIQKYLHLSSPLWILVFFKMYLYNFDQIPPKKQFLISTFFSILKNVLRINSYRLFAQLIGGVFHSLVFFLSNSL